MLFGLLFEVLVKRHFCEIDGRVLWGCRLGRSSGGAGRGTGVQSSLFVFCCRGSMLV